MGNICYSIVVPLFNEELVIRETYRRLKTVMDSTNQTYEIILINDGSRDNTLNIAKELCKKDSNIKLICFSRNFGHQTAVTAGLDYSSGDAIVVIDADLQDPPEVILKMIEKWKEGYDVVYGKRLKRKGETYFKKVTSKAFYRALSKITDVDIPVDAGDFRLIDRKVCDALKLLPERNRYIRGLVSWVGFKQTGVEFVREERYAGDTKYPIKKMIKFAADAITSFSYKPLKLAMYAGGAISIMSFIFFAIMFFDSLLSNNSIFNFLTITVSSLFFNGLVLLILGIIGEYIGRLSDEAKKRPLYIISEREGFKCETNSKSISNF